MNSKTLFDKNGNPVAYIADDYNTTIYLWDGSPVAYIYEGEHVYGINGRHLGWWLDEILYNVDGHRIGFASGTCPVAIGKESPKNKKQRVEEIRPRWKAPPLPKLLFDFASQDLVDFLREGQIARFYEEPLPEESQESET
ncbi:MAG: hypothetical protein JSW56_08810 [Deltaproteobacteria bacterium]|nr:MAG: hypothetical protein JSW56_08810 [Deltaproteobacteria bacterium]